jgi:hypothetical protein
MSALWNRGAVASRWKNLSREQLADTHATGSSATTLAGLGIEWRRECDRRMAKAYFNEGASPPSQTARVRERAFVRAR